MNKIIYELNKLDQLDKLDEQDEQDELDDQTNLTIIWTDQHRINIRKIKSDNKMKIIQIWSERNVHLFLFQDKKIVNFFWSKWMKCI